MSWVWLHVIFFLMYVGFCFRVASRISMRSLVDVSLTAFTIFCGGIILTGFLLSYFHKIHDVRFWAWAVFIPVFLFYLRFYQLFSRGQQSFSFFSLIGSRIQLLLGWWRGQSGYIRALFVMPLLTVLGLGLVNLLLVLFTVPNEWDSMTGHLVRVLYFIQRHSMAPFMGTNWNIDTYPRSVSTIQIYSYLMLGRHENAFKLIHFLSYWVGVLATFGTAYRISRQYTASLFAALCFGLLPNVLLQSTTTDTDIVLMAYVSCLIYFLFTYHETLKRRYLYLTGIMIGIALGHKITLVLQGPSLLLILIYAVAINVRDLRLSLLRLKHLLVATLFSLVLFTLPTGYLSNLQRYGHPIGPPIATRHQSVERAGGLFSPNLYEQGTRNVVRYAFDFLNLDGLRNLPLIENGPNRWLKAPLMALERASPLRLEAETNYTITAFTYHRPYIFYNGLPYWGVLGFGLLWPLLFLVLLGLIRSRPHVFLGLAVLLHFAALAYSAPYDAFKGRYFISTALYASPFLVLLFRGRHSLHQPGHYVLKSYVALVTGLACISAILAVFLNERSLPVAYRGRAAAFDTPRMEQMTWARPDLTQAYRRFDRLVPERATVALADINDDFEYPLFGKRLSRRLIPINPFTKGLQPIPPQAEYLFFAASVIKPQPGDLRLGTDTTAAMRARVITPAEDYYLRKLR